MDWTLCRDLDRGVRGLGWAVFDIFTTKPNYGGLKSLNPTQPIQKYNPNQPNPCGLGRVGLGWRVDNIHKVDN